MRRASPEVHLAVVTQDGVIAAAGGQLVIAEATDEDVVAFQTHQRVVATNAWVDADDLVRIAQHAINQISCATATELLDHAGHGCAIDQAVTQDAATVTEQDVIARATGNLVIALTTKHHQRHAGREGGKGTAKHRIGAGGNHGVVIADVGVIVPWALRVQHQQTVGGVAAIGFGGLQIDVNRVIAQTGVEQRDGAFTRTVKRAIDVDGVGTKAGPQAHAIGKIAGAVGTVGDSALRQIGPAKGRDTTGQATHCNLGMGRLTRHRHIGNHDVVVVQRAGFAANQQQVAARAGIHVQATIDVVQMAGQEVRGSWINAGVQAKGRR